MTTQADDAFAELVARAQADPAVRALYVHGSRAFEGMSTTRSDYDLGLIAKGTGWANLKTAELDLCLISWPDFRASTLEGDDGARYIMAHAKVVIDRTDGELAALLREAGTFPSRNLARRADKLDGYANLLYRSLKNHRDGRVVEAHFDGANSVRHALWVIFALHERIRPPSKYLRWELDHHPLGTGWLDAGQLLPRLQRILADADPRTQRELFGDIEALARSVGLGDTLDAWRSDLEVMRPG